MLTVDPSELRKYLNSAANQSTLHHSMRCPEIADFPTSDEYFGLDSIVHFIVLFFSSFFKLSRVLSAVKQIYNFPGFLVSTYFEEPSLSRGNKLDDGGRTRGVKDNAQDCMVETGHQ